MSHNVFRNANAYHRINVRRDPRRQRRAFGNGDEGGDGDR